MSFENLKLIMHVGGSKRRAGQAIRDTKDVRRGFHHLKDDQKDVEAMIAKRNAEGVRDVLMKFFNDLIFEEDVLYGISDSTQVVEYRVLRIYHEIEILLKQVLEPSILKEHVQSILSVRLHNLRNAFDTIKVPLHQELQDSRHLKREGQALSDIAVATDDWLLRMIRIYAKHFKKDVQREERTAKDTLSDLKELVHILEPFSKGATLSKDDAKRIEHLALRVGQDLNKAPKVFVKVFKDAQELEHEISLLSFRLEHMDIEELQKLHALLSQGFPPDFAKALESRNEEATKDIHDHFVSTYRQAFKITSKDNQFAKD